MPDKFINQLFLSQILEAVDNGILAIHNNESIALVNKKAEKILGLKEHELKGKKILDALPIFGRKLTECIKNCKSLFRYSLKYNSFDLICNFTPIFEDQKKKLIGAVIMIKEKREIEEISKNLQLFQQHVKMLDAIFESSYDGLWICDHRGKVLRINKASEKLNQLRSKDIIGRNVRDLVKEGVFDRSVTLEVLKKKRAVTFMQNLKNGKKLLVTGNPIFLNGKLRYVLTNDRDITELIRLKEELEESRKISRKYFEKLKRITAKEEKEKSFIFCSKEMKVVYEAIQRVSSVDVTVFLQGESGVGKGLVARIIHQNSSRSKEPFIHVNCGAIPENLLESELFGYDEGAFTGAKKEGKIGMFEMANKGTLFLDEITEMPLKLQVKLLHFLDTGEINRVGGITSKKLDVRIIAASNRDVESLVKEKKFRHDLFFRINIVPIVIPPLRERPDDIPLLLTYFLKRYSEQYKKDFSITSEVVDLLSQYSFPGNIRELSNLVERMVIMTKGAIIDLSSLPKYIKESVKLPFNKVKKWQGFSLKQALREFEMQIIQEATKKCKNQQELAKLLGISQPTVARKLRSYKLKSFN